MNILDKKQVNELIGELSVWKRSPHNQMAAKVEYLGGIPALDELLQSKNIEFKSLFVDFEIRPKGLEVSIVKGFNNLGRVAIEKEKVIFWSAEPQNDILNKKSKSIIGRALLGGLLLGPIGAIVGGMTGVGDKVVKFSDVDNILSVSYKESDLEFMILFGCKDKHIKDVFAFFRNAFVNKFKSPEDIKAEELSNMHQPTLSLADELKKWKDLLDAGAITSEEYDTQKLKLLKT
jgi:hypothetical protein